MQRLEVSGAVRPIYGSLGVKRLISSSHLSTDLPFGLFLSGFECIPLFRHTSEISWPSHSPVVRRQRVNKLWGRKVDGCLTSIKFSLLHFKFIFCTADISRQLLKYSRPANISLICKVDLLLTYLLTAWSRVLLEKLTFCQLVKKFPTFYGTRRFITAFTCARHLSLSWASSIQSISPHLTSWRFILILCSKLICERRQCIFVTFPQGYTRPCQDVRHLKYNVMV